MQKELLPPADYYPQLENRLKNINTTLSQLKKIQTTQPQGHLRIAQKGNVAQFYLYNNPKDFKGHFLPRSQDKLAQELAQKDYNIKAIKELEKEITALENYLRKTGSGSILKEIYDRLCPARQKLITPLTLTEEQYADQWLDVSWQGRPFSDDTPQYRTAKGERVRSKSELIIADTLFRHHIPYRYEFPITLRNEANNTTTSPATVKNFRKHSTETVTFYPDFLCLNLRTRQTYYWEHFGLMDDPAYAENAASKLRLYTENNIIPGRNLILTMETQNEHLSTQTLENIIASCLK